MRLIRLTTEDNRCVFDSVFNSDLVIKPYSKIALSSFTTQLNNLNMVIDSQNNEIQYSVEGQTYEQTLTLPNGVYTSSTIGNFWIETTRLFNKSMKDRRSQINRQWFCGIDGGRAVFQCKYGSRVFVSSYISSSLYVSRGMAPGGSGQGIVKKGNAGSNNAFIYIKSPNNKGCSSLRSALYADSGSGVQSGYVMGYTAENPSASTTVINPIDYLYAIRYKDLLQPYGIIINGVESVTTIMPLIGDTFDITCYGGEIRLYIYRATGNTVQLLHDDPYDHETNLFPLMLFVGTTTIINGIQFTSDPYYNQTNTQSGDEITHTNNLLTPIPTTNEKTNCYLQFINPDLGILLGFNKTRYPPSGFNNVAEPIFLGEKPFSLRDYSESYIVELLNIKLDSMDSQSKGPKNFLYVIPQLSAIREHVVYQVPQLIFLNLNNATDINLRELRARILKDDLSSITCYGISELVIILKEKDEI
jgi:hypothetical protein